MFSVLQCMIDYNEAESLLTATMRSEGVGR